MKLLILACTSVSLAACTSRAATELSACERDNPLAPRICAPLNHDFTIRVGQQAIIEQTNLRVAFKKVLEDSRCPEKAVCVWAGNGRILLELRTTNGEVAESSLNTMLEPRKESHFGYTVELRGLQPYPRLDTPQAEKSYSATLVVMK